MDFKGFIRRIRNEIRAKLYTRKFYKSIKLFLQLKDHEKMVIGMMLSDEVINELYIINYLRDALSIPEPDLDELM